MYLLDTNAWISLFRRKSARLSSELQQHPSAEIALCSIVLTELWYGVLRSDPAFRQRNSEMVEQLQATYVSLPFGDVAAKDCAELRAELAIVGQPIGPNDALIAAIARTNRATLVTHNTVEFSRVPRLSVVDWQAPIP
ncbi:MAG TPA: PIN domain-containing protein [Planctomycetaceae bacterium]|nr:PIN domain-containing protein [Planctomycetaceae bacterium]